MSALVLPPMALGADEFDLAWRRLGLGDKPVLLKDAQAFAPTLDELSRVDRAAWSRLEQQGLVEAERVEPDLEDVLRALAVPVVQVDIRIWSGPGPHRSALGCTAGEIAVVASVTDGTVRLIPVEPSQLATELLTHLPEHPPAPGRPISIPAHLVDGGRLTVETSQAVLERAGLPPSTIQQLRRVLTGRTRLQASIGAAVRDDSGVLLRSDQAIAVLDTDYGRVMIQRRDSDVSIAPAGRREVASEVASFVEAHRRSVVGVG